jgi:hypothetical protein
MTASGVCNELINVPPGTPVLIALGQTNDVPLHDIFTITEEKDHNGKLRLILVANRTKLNSKLKNA